MKTLSLIIFIILLTGCGSPYREGTEMEVKRLKAERDSYINLKHGMTHGQYLLDIKKELEKIENKLKSLEKD